MGSEETFDLSASGLRADGAELTMSVEVLAGKLEAALPGHVKVQRQGGFLGRGERRVRSVRVEIGGNCYELDVAEGAMNACRQRQVGGISIKSETLAPAEWIAGLTEDLRLEAARSGQARAALETLLE